VTFERAGIALQATVKRDVVSQVAQAHSSRKRGIFINYYFMVLEPGRDLRERPVLGNKRSLTI